MNLTKPYDEPEEFILTSDEVYDVINHEVRSLIKHHGWKLRTNRNAK